MTMDQKDVQNLQNLLRVIAQMHRELAERTMEAAGLIGKIVHEACSRTNTEMHPYFPENDYGTIATQITLNPNLKKKRKWKTESWPSYAIRISKYVKWSVDEQALKTSFDLLLER